MPNPAEAPEAARETALGTTEGESPSMVREVLRLAIPAIAQSLMYTVMLLTDRAMLGHYSASALASMQIAGPLSWASFSVLGAFTAGTVAVVGRHVGAEDKQGASSALRASMLLGALLGVAGIGIGFIVLEVLPFIFPGAGAEVHADAYGYLSVFFSAIPIILVSIAAGSALQAAGDTRTPFVITVVMVALNFGLNYALIFGRFGAPEMGARGAALGTAIASTVELLAFAIVLSRRSGVLSARGRGGERDAMRRVLKIAVPSFGERSIQHVGYLGFVMMITALGATAMAANQALISIESICFMSADGFGIAAAAIVSQRLGAKQPERARSGLYISITLSVVLLATFALAFVIIPEPLIRAFTSDDHIAEAALPCMLIAAASQPFLAASVVLAQGLRGAGDTRAAFGVMLISGMGVRLLATYIAAFTFELGLLGVWIGSTTDWIVRGLLLWWRARGDAWQKAEV